MKKSHRKLLVGTAFVAFGVLVAILVFPARFAKHPSLPKPAAAATQSTLVPIQRASESDVLLDQQRLDSEIPEQNDEPVPDPSSKRGNLPERAELLAGAERFGAKVKAEIAVAYNQRLLDAGFSQQRIDELKQRKNELLMQLQQADFEARQRGEPLNPSSLSGALDNDLLLREVMSDEEYMNYRRALGKQTAFAVIEVLPNSPADQAGILPGDQVVRYDNKRVFDYRELEALALSNTSGGSAIVEVRRDGNTFTVVLPKGPTGLSTPNTMKSTISSEILNHLFGLQ